MENGLLVVRSLLVVRGTNSPRSTVGKFPSSLMTVIVVARGHYVREVLSILLLFLFLTMIVERVTCERWSMPPLPGDVA
jgi:hypothetical protein